MANAAAQQIAERILKFLPEDGTPVLNRVMRVMLARDMARPLPPETYFKICDELVRQGKIGRSRGQGGQIFYMAEEDNGRDLRPQPEQPGWTEARLMEPLKRYLMGPFRADLGLPADSVCIVQDTSRVGPVLGRWARPDFVMITAMRFKLLPGAQLDVHSFELKSERGATDLAVYEALAQTRFTHFGHMVWHLPKGSASEARFTDIERQCDQHGIGLILIRDPERVDGCEIVLDPIRKATPPADVDGFLESRLAGNDQSELRNILNGGGHEG
jgi:hypothetical protein